MDGSLSLSTPDGADIHRNFFGQSLFAQHTIVSGNSVVKIPSETEASIFTLWKDREGINSGDTAWFLICTSHTSQQS
jgi:hypothetical protein